MFLSEIQEYLIIDCPSVAKAVKDFMNKEIDLEFEIDGISLMVYGVEDIEDHNKIRKFLTDNNYWYKERN